MPQPDQRRAVNRSGTWRVASIAAMLACGTPSRRVEGVNADVVQAVRDGLMAKPGN